MIVLQNKEDFDCQTIVLTKENKDSNGIIQEIEKPQFTNSRPKRKRTAPKDLSDFLVDHKHFNKKSRLGRKHQNLENNSEQQSLEDNQSEAETLENSSTMINKEQSGTVSKSREGREAQEQQTYQEAEDGRLDGELDKSDRDENTDETEKGKSGPSKSENKAEDCVKDNYIDELTEMRGIGSESDERYLTEMRSIGSEFEERCLAVKTESSSQDGATSLQETLEVEKEGKSEESDVSTQKKIHNIPRDVIKKLKMLEKRSKEHRKSARHVSKENKNVRRNMSTEHNTSQNKEQEIVPVKNEDLIIKCMTCGLECSAAFVKCLLCFERLPRDTMRHHMAIDHQFYSHVTCWMTCSYRHNAAVIGELKDRILAKKVCNVSGSEDLETSAVFQCSLCEHREATEEEMKDHLIMMHEIKKCYMCQTCGDMFKNPGTKREHRHYCSGGEPMKCDQCFKVLDGPKSLWMHIRAEHSHERKVIDTLTDVQKMSDINPAVKTAECIKCGDGCATEFVKCLLCSTVVLKDTLKYHIESCHANSTTKQFMFRCVENYLGKEYGNPLSQQVEHVIGKSVPETSNEVSEPLTSSKCNVQCSLCSEQCIGITMFGKHCRYEHGIKVVFMCKVCKDVFRTASMRDKHFKYCVYGQQSFSEAQKYGRDESPSVSSFITLALRKHSSQLSPFLLEDIPQMEFGAINENPQQKSHCLKCAKDMHSCMSYVLRCFLCHQNIPAECLDEHMIQQHAHLQGSQCFTCGKRGSHNKDQSVLGFNRIIDPTVKTIGTEAKEDDGECSAEHMGMTGITCLYCGAQYSDFKDFVAHCSGQHKVTEMHYCSKCPMIFNTKFSQTEHEFFCSMGGAPYCRQCNQLFASPQMLKKHEREQHSSKAEESHVIVKCPYCDSYEKPGIGRYRVHLQTVHKYEKIFICKTCFQVFDQGYKKDMHEHEAHANKVTYCTECKKDFSTPIKLHRHINYWHKGGKHKEMIRRRQVTEKLCQYCGKGFKVLANLRDHVNRYHLQYKAYSCKYCDKKFYHTFAKQKHEFKDHAAGYYQCSFCTHKAFSNWDLKKHVERMHGANYIKKNNSRIELKQETITCIQNTGEDAENSIEKQPMYILEGDFVEATANASNSNEDSHTVVTEETNEFDSEVVESSSLQNVVYQIQDEEGQVYEVKGLGSEMVAQHGLDVMTVDQASQSQETVVGEEMVILLSN